MREFSKILFNMYGKPPGQYSEVAKIKNPMDDPDGFFKFIGADDCEDLVGLYLQKEKGFYIIPSTGKSSAIASEFLLKHKTDGKSAGVQVKQGPIDISGDDITDAVDEKYLFTTQGYADDSASDTTAIQPSELYDFAMKNKQILPDRITYWLEFFEETDPEK